MPRTIRTLAAPTWWNLSSRVPSLPCYSGHHCCCGRFCTAVLCATCVSLLENSKAEIRFPLRLSLLLQLLFSGNLPALKASVLCLPSLNFKRAASEIRSEVQMENETSSNSWIPKTSDMKQSLDFMKTVFEKVTQKCETSLQSNVSLKKKSKIPSRAPQPN